MTAPLTCLFSLSGPEAYINCLSPDEQITYTHAHLFPHYQYGRLLSRDSHILQLHPPRIVTNSSLFAQIKFADSLDLQTRLLLLPIIFLSSMQSGDQNMYHLTLTMCYLA
jgi:hypothetical protein